MPTNNQPTNQKQLVVSMLRDARALIDSQGSWSKLALGRNQKGERVPVNSNNIHSYCIYGALLAISRKNGASKTIFRTSVNVLNKLCRIIYGKGIKKYGSEEDLSEFGCFPLTYTNDSLIKNQAEAQRLLNAAIKSLDKKLASKPGQAQATPPAKPEVAKDMLPLSQPSGAPAEVNKAVTTPPGSEATPPLPTTEAQLGQPQPEAQQQLGMVDEGKPEGLALAVTPDPEPEPEQIISGAPTGEGMSLAETPPLAEPQAEIAPLQAEIAPLQAEIAPLQAEIAPLQAEIAPLQAEIAPLQAEIAPLQAEIAPLQAEIAPLQIEESPEETGNEYMQPSASGTEEPQQPVSYQLPNVSELEVKTDEKEQEYTVNPEAETAISYTSDTTDTTDADEYTVMDISHKPVLLNEHEKAEDTPDDLIEIDIDVSEDKDNN